MGALGGNALRSRRIAVRGGALTRAALTLAEAQGHIRVDDAPDVLVVEANEPDELEPCDAPILVLSPRRLRPSHVKTFREAGAARVLDSHASVLDVAFAFADLLFESMCEQRRYARQHGGLAVSFCAVDGGRGDASDGRIVQLARSGTYVLTEDVEPLGTPIEMTLRLAGHPVRLLGRVACLVGQDDRRGFGVEFALDSSEVAPRLVELTGPPSRSPSNLPAHPLPV